MFRWLIKILFSATTSPGHSITLYLMDQNISRIKNYAKWLIQSLKTEKEIKKKKANSSRKEILKRADITKIDTKNKSIKPEISYFLKINEISKTLSRQIKI